MLPPKIILTTTDFSDASGPGVRAAARMAQSTGAALHVLFVEDTVFAEAARQSNIDINGQTGTELKSFVATAVAPAAITPTFHIRSGDAVENILGTATSIGADMLVMASHGRTGVGRAVFGSITEGVLRKTTIPVLVIPDEYTE